MKNMGKMALFYNVYLIFSQYFIISLYLTLFLCAHLKMSFLLQSNQETRQRLCVQSIQRLQRQFFGIFVNGDEIHILWIFSNQWNSYSFLTDTNGIMKKVLHFSPIRKIISNKTFELLIPLQYNGSLHAGGFPIKLNFSI